MHIDDSGSRDLPYLRSCSFPDLGRTLLVLAMYLSHYVPGIALTLIAETGRPPPDPQVCANGADPLSLT